MNTPTNTLYRFAITLTVQSPFLVQGNDPGRFGIDATQLTNEHGRPIIPGTLLLGRVQEATGKAYKQWFGQEGFGGQRTRVRVQDLLLQSINGNKDTVRTRLHPEHDLARIAVDESTGSVQQGALLLIEQIAKPGAALCFEGEWQAWCADENEADKLRQTLENALAQQTQIGAYRGIGFGRLRKVQVQCEPVKPCAAPALQLGAQGAAAVQRLALRFEQPICVGSDSVASNLFVSSDIISGGTLKGALAQSLLWQSGATSIQQLAHQKGAWGQAVAQHFDAIRLTHALPTPVGQARPLPLPYSLVRTQCAGHDVVQDVWPQTQPPQHAAGATALAFQMDRKDKDFKLTADKRSWGTTRTHLRVRTAIQDGMAAESQLFAYECRYSPLDTQAGTNPGQPLTHWVFDVDLSAVKEDERPAVWQQLKSLLAYGLAPIGKTDAWGQVSQMSHTDNLWPDCFAPITAQSDAHKASLICVVLVSDTLLFTTQQACGLQAHESLQAVYQEAFESMLGNDEKAALTLSHCFARQKLVGGAVLLNHQVQKQKVQKQKQDTSAHPPQESQDQYQPWVLTEAGSVFVFQVNDAAKAKQILQRWRSQGLPLPQEVKTAYSDNWCFNPYLPQNGYGEVAIAPQHGFGLYPNNEGATA